MKPKYFPRQSTILHATRIEVHQVLADNFGSPHNPTSQGIQKESEQMNFKLDRLFTVLHSN
ncbi:hypothetical protein [Marinoscillum sp.]|uniref:hypothetical protein n=1 Tax=Marinoscillum sp. TaxID=2024838 RepID=UPI003BABF7A1